MKLKEKKNVGHDNLHLNYNNKACISFEYTSMWVLSNLLHGRES